jgi:hypothetical protein
MSQFYDQASLVMVPSGYKNGKVYSQKPLSTDGELTFTRASNATRVGPDGLIQKVRTNLLTYSNDFSNAAWGKSFAALTGGQSGYDGTNNAWKLQASGSTSCYIQQGSFSVLRAHSIYAKAGTYDQISIINGGYGQGVQFDLTSGTIVTNSNSSIYSPTITSVGSGWYKISLGIQSSAPTYGFLIAPQLLNGGGIVDGEYIYIQNAQTEYNDIATDYIATTSSAVSVGPVSGLPRLDYSGGCPSLLLEPQRVNDVVNNTALNNHTAYNASWGVNVAVAPSGYQEAEKLIENTSNSTHFWGVGLSYTSGTTYTLSVYIKAAERDEFLIQVGNPSVINFGAVFNLSTKVVNNLGSGTAAIVDAGNGWFRCIIRNVTALSNGSTNFNCFLRSGGTINYTGDGTSGAYFWGVQREIGAYETSLIPTLSTSVTRVAETAVKTGISSLIGQTEGTAFIEFSVEHLTSGNNILFNLSDGTSPNSIYANWYEFGGGNRIEYAVYIGGALVVGFNHSIAIGTHKLAFAYKANDFVAYVDGVAVGSDTSGSVPATSRLSIGSWTTPAFYYSGRVSQALLFKTRLTNAQLAELTTL